MIKQIAFFISFMIVGACSINQTSATGMGYEADIAHFQALTGLSQTEVQALVTTAQSYISDMHSLGYSDEDIDALLNHEMGSVSNNKKTRFVPDHCVRKRTLWLAIIATTLVASTIASFAAVNAYIMVKVNN